MLNNKINYVFGSLSPLNHPVEKKSISTTPVSLVLSPTTSKIKTTIITTTAKTSSSTTTTPVPFLEFDRQSQMAYSVFATTTQIPKTTPKTTPETTLKKTQIPLYAENRQSQMPYSVFQASTTEIPYSVHMSTTPTSPDESFHLIDVIADLTEASISQSTDLKSADLDSTTSESIPSSSPSQSTKVPSKSSSNPNESKEDNVSVKSTTVSIYSEEKLESRTSNTNEIITEPTQGK